MRVLSLSLGDWQVCVAVGFREAATLQPSNTRRGFLVRAANPNRGLNSRAHHPEAPGRRFG